MKAYYTVAVTTEDNLFIRYTCGHRHTTVSAARRCRLRLLDYRRTGGALTWEAKWHRSKVLAIGSDGRFWEPDAEGHNLGQLVEAV